MMTPEELRLNLIPPAQGPVVFRPPWADPGYILASTFTRFSVVAVLGVPQQKLVGGDPRRIGIAFCGNAGSAPPNVIYPEQGQQGYGLVFTSTSTTGMLTLFNNGPFIMSAWYCDPLAAANVGVYEWLIL